MTRQSETRQYSIIMTTQSLFSLLSMGGGVWLMSLSLQEPLTLTKKAIKQLIGWLTLLTKDRSDTTT